MRARSAEPALYGTLGTAVQCGLSRNIHERLLAPSDRGRAYRWSYVTSVACSMPGRDVLPTEHVRARNLLGRCYLFCQV